MATRERTHSPSSKTVLSRSRAAERVPRDKVKKPTKAHFFQVWRERVNMSREEAARLASKYLGYEIDKRYVEGMEYFQRRPIWEKCEAFSKVSRGKFPPEMFMQYGYRSSRGSSTTAVKKSSSRSSRRRA